MGLHMQNTLANSYKKFTAVEVGYAAMDGEKEKYDNYKELVNENYYVVPIAHETMGSWAPESLKSSLRTWDQESPK